jgi:hypothetical protein
MIKLMFFGKKLLLAFGFKAQKCTCTMYLDSTWFPTDHLIFSNENFINHVLHIAYFIVTQCILESRLQLGIGIFTST